MPNYLFLLLSLGIVFLVITIERLLSYFVKRYITNQGWTLLESRWAGIQPGGYLSKGDPIYQIRYLDKSGSEHNAYLRMSFIYGIKIEEDRIIK